MSFWCHRFDQNTNEKFDKFLPYNLKSGQINKTKALSYNIQSFIYDYMGYSMYQRHYGVPLSYYLTTFQIIGQKFSNFFVGILVQTMTPKGHFEINLPLPI